MLAAAPEAKEAGAKPGVHLRQEEISQLMNQQFNHELMIKFMILNNAPAARGGPHKWWLN